MELNPTTPPMPRHLSRYVAGVRTYGGIPQGTDFTVKAVVIRAQTYVHDEVVKTRHIAMRLSLVIGADGEHALFRNHAQSYFCHNIGLSGGGRFEHDHIISLLRLFILRLSIHVLNLYFPIIQRL